MERGYKAEPSAITPGLHCAPSLPVPLTVLAAVTEGTLSLGCTAPLHGLSRVEDPHPVARSTAARCVLLAQDSWLQDFHIPLVEEQRQVVVCSPSL